MATTQMCGRNGWHDLCLGLVLDGTACDCDCHRMKIQVTMSGDALLGVTWNASVQPITLQPQPCVTCGDQGYVGDGGYVACPVCGHEEAGE